MIREDKFTTGKRCTVNSYGDLMMNKFQNGPFIGKECIIIKRTKHGLIQVCLSEDNERSRSFAQRNIDLIED